MIRWGDKTLMARINGECRGFEDCDIIWFPKIPHVEMQVIDGVAMGHRPNGRRGVWALACIAEIPFASDFHGATVVSTVTRPIPIWKLDGKFGNSRTPGDWMIYAILESDTQPRGMDRWKELQEWEQESIARRHNQANKLLEDAVTGGDAWKAFKAAAADSGVPSTLKEERVAIGRQMEKNADRAHQRGVDEAKDAAFL